MVLASLTPWKLEMTNAFVPTCNFTSPAEGTCYLKTFIFFDEVYAITIDGHPLWLFSAWSSRICASHSELRWSSRTGATPPLTPQAGCCLHVPAACPVVLIWLVAWPCCLTRLVNDAAKIGCPPFLFFNDMIALLSVTAGKRDWGRQESFQPALALQSSKCGTRLWAATLL